MWAGRVTSVRVLLMAATENTFNKKMRNSFVETVGFFYFAMYTFWNIFAVCLIEGTGYNLIFAFSSQSLVKFLYPYVLKHCFQMAASDMRATRWITLNLWKKWDDMSNGSLCWSGVGSGRGGRRRFGRTAAQPVPVAAPAPFALVIANLNTNAQS